MSVRQNKKNNMNTLRDRFKIYKENVNKCLNLVLKTLC